MIYSVIPHKIFQVISCNVVKRPQNTLVPVLIYDIAAPTKHFLPLPTYFKRLTLSIQSTDTGVSFDKTDISLQKTSSYHPYNDQIYVALFDK